MSMASAKVLRKSRRLSLEVNVILDTAFIIFYLPCCWSMRLFCWCTSIVMHQIAWSHKANLIGTIQADILKLQKSLENEVEAAFTLIQAERLFASFGAQNNTATKTKS